MLNVVSMEFLCVSFEWEILYLNVCTLDGIFMR